VRRLCEALRFPEASEGGRDHASIMGRSGLVAMVEVMSIDSKVRDGCCQRRVSGVVIVSRSEPRATE
jgi:hypothetical protein